MDNYEPLELHHFAEYGAVFIPWDATGWVLRVDGEIILLGGLCDFRDGRQWIVFHSKGGPPLSVHRKAVELIGAAQSAGLEAVWATVDESVPRAEAWVRRFGFNPSGETCSASGHAVWRLDLGICGTNNALYSGGRRSA